MIKSIRGEYLLTNELRRTSDGMRVDGQRPSPNVVHPNSFFSPTVDRRKEAYATMGDDPYAKVEGSKLFSPPHTAGFAGVQHGHAVQHGMQPHTPQQHFPGADSHSVFRTPAHQSHMQPPGTAAESPSFVTMHSARYSASVDSHESHTPAPSIRSNTPAQYGRIPSVVPQRHPPLPQYMAYGGAPGPPNAPHVSPVHIDRADVESIASVETALTGTWSTRSTPSSASHRSEAEPDGAGHDAEIEADASQPYQPSHRGDGKWDTPADASAGPTHQEAADPMASSHAFENELLRKQLQAQQDAHAQQMRQFTAMMQSMQQAMSQSQIEQKASLARIQESTNYVGKGLEDWVVQERLQRDFHSEYGFWWVVEQRWEDGPESMLRARVYMYLKRRLPPEIVRGTIENDVRTVWINIVRINTDMAADQVVFHMRTLLKMLKGSQPMLTWLNKIYEKVEQLEALNKPVDQLLIRSLITESLEGDKRYEMVLIDITKNQHWDMAEIKSRLTAAAAKRGDLVPDERFQKKQQNKERRQASKALKKQGQSGKTAKTAQLAHGDPSQRATGKGDTAAEAAKVDKQKRDRLRNELCKLHLIGKCTRGSSCYRKHMTLDEVKEEASQRSQSSKKGKDGSKSSPNKGNGAQPSSESKNLNQGICFDWRDKGECTHDNCKFKHANMLRALPASTKLRVGDRVSVDSKDPTFADLYGALGTVVDITAAATKRNSARYGVRLSLPQALLNEKARALVQRAEREGIHEDNLIPIDNAHDNRVASKFKAFKAKRSASRSPYSANIICDSGSNVLMTSVVELFAHLVPCTPDENRVAGLGDIEVRATHKGPVMMKFGPFSMKRTGYYAPHPTNYTIVPSVWFDDGEWSYACQNQTMYLFKQVKGEAVCCGRFPRRIEIAPDRDHGAGLMSSLVPGVGPQRLHSLYPMPDSVFVWHQTHKVNVVTRKESASPIKPTRARKPEPEAKALAPILGGERILPVNPDPMPEAIYVWSDHAHKDSGKRATGVIRGIRDLHNFHHVSGHRSANHTATLYAWIYGKAFSQTVRLNQRRCNSCDVAKSAREAFAKNRLVKMSPGEAIAGDTIVGLPQSHSGYVHCGHWHDIGSNFGAIVMSSNKELGPHFYRFYIKMELLTDKWATYAYIDRGELATKQLEQLAFEKGTTIVKNIADSHTNPTIEIRHKTLVDMSNAMLDRGGANAACWEYTFPTCNFILNISFKVREMARLGMPGKGKQRPLTPFEQLVAKGEYVDIKQLWNNVQGIFELCTAHIEGGPAAHGNRGYRAINLGIIPDEDLACTSFGYYVLRLDDKKVYRARTVRNVPGVFPWRPAPRRALPPPGTDDDGTDSDAEDPSPSGGDGAEATKGKGEESPEPEDPPESEPEPEPEPEPKPKVAQDAKPARGRGRPRKHKKQRVFQPGDKVMTTGGPCIVIKRYDDGDYAITWDSNTGPQEVFTVSSTDIWLDAEWPEFSYTHEGKHADPELPHMDVEGGPKSRLKSFKPRQDDKDEAKCPINAGAAKPAVDAPAGRTRSKQVTLHARQIGNGPAGYRIFDKSRKYGVRIMQHCHGNLVPDTIRCRALKAKGRPPPTLPENFPLKVTRDMLRDMRACDVAQVLPQHFHQTLHSPLRDVCEQGEIQELQDCLNREVWGRPRPRTADDIVIPLMWVYAVKKQKDNSNCDRIRSRITLMGNRERNLLAKLDAYAPVAQMVTSRLLIALHLHQPEVRIRKIDVKNAYINEDMRRKVLTKLPPGYTWFTLPDGDWSLCRLEPGEKQPDDCMVLQKALYGGMECGRIFWEAWVDWHLAHGFQAIHEDRCYLAKFGPNGTFIKMAFHVDDSLIVTRGDSFYEEYLAQVSKKFDIKEEPLTEHLGVTYVHDPEAGTMHMCQEAQIEKLLSIFGMSECKAVDTPTLSGPLPCEEDCADPDDTNWDMQAFVGHLQWLYQCTRPDIGQPLKILSRFTTRFGRKHVQFAKHVLRYLKGTIKQGLDYQAGFPLYFQIFTDASHASCVDTRRSILSVMFKLGGMLVFWKNYFSSMVSHSSCESELYALDMGATNGEGLRYLTEAMDGPQQETIQVFVDNQGTIDITSNPVQSGRNLHVHARYFYVRDLVYAGKLVIVHLPTCMQIADIGCSYKGSHNFSTLRTYIINTARIVHDTNGNPVWDLLTSCGDTKRN